MFAFNFLLLFSGPVDRWGLGGGGYSADMLDNKTHTCTCTVTEYSGGREDRHRRQTHTVEQTLRHTDRRQDAEDSQGL